MTTTAMTLTTTKGTYTVTSIEAAAARIAELVPSHADLDGAEIEVPVPADDDTDESWTARCLAAVESAQG